MRRRKRGIKFFVPVGRKINTVGFGGKVKGREMGIIPLLSFGGKGRGGGNNPAFLSVFK